MSANRKHPLAECESCPLNATKYKPAHSTGPSDARVAVVGQAPGRTEASKGKPFVGPSGKLLDQVLAAKGLPRSQVFTTNVVLCRPPDDDPPAKAVECCAPRLRAELSTLGPDDQGPDKILTLGNYATGNILGLKKPAITRDRVGPPKQVTIHGKTVDVVPTLHPASLLRDADNYRSFIQDIDKLITPPQEWQPPEWYVIDDPEEAVAYLDVIPQGAVVACDIETNVEKDSDFTHPDSLLCIGLATSGQQAVVLERNALKYDSVKQSFNALNDRAYFIYQNGKFDVGVLWYLGYIESVDNSIYFDTMLAHYCLDERSAKLHGLENMSREYLGSPSWKDATSGYDGYDKVPPQVLDEYNAYDVANTFRLYDIFKSMLEEEEMLHTHDMLVRISEQLVYIERKGMKIDVGRLQQLKQEFEQSLNDREEYLSQWVRNPRSPQQVKQALWDHFEVTTPSTDKQHLQSMCEATDDNELAAFLSGMLLQRIESKLYGTYLKGLLSRISNDERVYPNILLHGTTTGRTSSRNPNLQNIPRGEGIRSVFVPDSEEYQWVYADYGSVELRIVCVLAREENLQRILLDGRKPHKEVAIQYAGPDFSLDNYVKAKSVVHGVNYGRTPYGIAKGLNIPLSEAKEIYDVYVDMVPGLFEWQEEVKQKLLTDQVLTSVFGRKRRYPLITKFNRDDIINEAIAFEPQSTASDINTLAAVELNKRGFDVRLMVHDSILVQVRRDNAEAEKEGVKQVMEYAAQEHFMTHFPDFKMEFPVDADVADNWGAFKE